MDASHNKLAADKHGFSDHQEILRLRADRDVLLEALKSLDALWSEDIPQGPGEAGDIRLFAPETLAVWRAARQAIATAEGGR